MSFRHKDTKNTNTFDTILKFRHNLNSDFQIVTNENRQHGGGSDPGSRQHGGTPSPTAERDREGTRPTDSSPSEKHQAQAAEGAGAGGDPPQRDAARTPSGEQTDRPTGNNRAGKRGTRRAAPEAPPSPSPKEGTKGTPHYIGRIQNYFSLW